MAGKRVPPPIVGHQYRLAGWGAVTVVAVDHDYVTMMEFDGEVHRVTLQSWALHDPLAGWK